MLFKVVGVKLRLQLKVQLCIQTHAVPRECLYPSSFEDRLYGQMKRELLLCVCGINTVHL